MSKNLEILRYLKSKPDGKTYLRVRGELYETVADIPDERVQRVIRKAIADMVEMGGGIDYFIKNGLIDYHLPAEPQTIDDIQFEAPEAPVMPAQPSVPADTQIEETLNDSFEIQAEEPALSFDELEPIDQEAAFLNSLQQAPPQAEEQDTSLIGRFRAMQNREIPSIDEVLPQLDFAGQINRILQQKLSRMPQLAGRQIELRSKVGGELVFIVDGQAYESVNDIPPGDAADLMKSAIAQWNQS